MVHAHTAHLPLGALLIPCTVCVAQAQRLRAAGFEETRTAAEAYGITARRGESRGAGEAST